ncbi:MAG: ORF6N domain-containing protein [Candidatus Rokubacteria bacterium]|nr:ORF6N domain-containing protein [Candidatus Rokubacteria bacterium]
MGSAERRSIEHAIITLRQQRAMLDSDLARLYGVRTKALVQAVKRNRARFPTDFMFQLSRAEATNLRSQIVTSSLPHGGRRYRPYAFTEQGVAMLSSVLKSHRAIAVNVAIMRAFVRLRMLLSENAVLARRLDALEAKYEARFRVVFDAIRTLMATPVSSEHRIGFDPSRALTPPTSPSPTSRRRPRARAAEARRP